MSLDSINEKLEQQRGKVHGYPSALSYTVGKVGEDYELRVKDSEGATTNDVWKLADPWGFAAFDDVRNELQDLLKTPFALNLRFVMRSPSNKKKPKYEALKRRLSYLAHANKGKLSVILETDCKPDSLYTMSELRKRPENEIVREDFPKRSNKDTPGRLEKDFQMYLFGKCLYKDKEGEIQTNERLALFGEDFIKINKGVEREFPTGVFNEVISDNTRILPTEFIDFVTINKHDEIAIIELKFNDSPLEVIAQLLNYALFFYSYKEKLEPLLLGKLDYNGKWSDDHPKIKAYIVSNVFHARFDKIWSYYSKGSIPMRQVIMGYMPKN